MKLNVLKKRVMGAVLGMSLLVGIGITSSLTAQAQWQSQDAQREQMRRQREWERDQIRRQRDYRDENWRYSNRDLRQTALNAGYNEGIKEGRKDRQNRDRFDYRDEEDFRNANTDYNSRLGNRELYRQYFRQGFANGYTDGYRGY